MNLFRRLILLLVFIAIAGSLLAENDSGGIGTFDEPVHIDYKVRTDDYYALTKEGNIFQGNADPVWQLKGQVGSSINDSNWPGWSSVADNPGSTPYSGGAWYYQSTVERWTGSTLSNADNVYIRMQGYENERTSTHTYVSGTDSYYSYDNYDAHSDLSGTVNRNSWTNFRNTESGNGDYANCGSTGSNNYYKAELDVWWDYQLPVNPDFTITNSSSDGFNIDLTDINNYRVTDWDYQVSTEASFSSVITSGVDVSSSFVIVTGLEDAATYYVRIRGSNERGTGSYTSSKSSATKPVQATYIFPSNGSANMPRTVSVNWRYSGSNTPTGFKVMQDDQQVGADINWNGNILYSKRLNTANWGETVNWELIALNSLNEYEESVNWSFTVMEEPAETENVPATVVYTELLNFSGTDTASLLLPTIDLGQGDVNPTIQLSFDTIVSNISTEVQLLDQPLNPLPQPQNCAGAIVLSLPSSRTTTITLNFDSSIIPSELVHWNSSVWENITASSNAIFTEGVVVFEWTSSSRGDEQFAVNGGNESTLPVILSSFTAVVSNSNYVTLNWVTQSESGILGYNILRSIDLDVDSAIRVNADHIYANNTTVECRYNYTDAEVEKDLTYSYWISSQELSGETEFFGPIQITISEESSEDLPEIAFITGLNSNYPNPFNPTTNISFTLKEASDVAIQIFNVRGQLVYDFNQSSYPIGVSSVVWNGKDMKGRSVSSGIYLTKMKAGNHNFTRKMIMMK